MHEAEGNEHTYFKYVEKNISKRANADKSIDDNSIEQELKYKLHNIRISCDQILNKDYNLFNTLNTYLWNKKLTKRKDSSFIRVMPQSRSI